MRHPIRRTQPINIQTAITWLIRPHQGSNRLSRFIRHKIETRPLAELIGIPLAALTFLAAFITPQVTAGFASTEVYFDTQTTAIEAVVAPSRFRWPLATFGISQYFSGRHRGIDLTNPAGTPMYPVAEGKVILVATLFYGYGKHVIIEHPDNISTLYAHMSRVDVKEGQVVTKNTELGTVGATGWATGNHLHLEIHQNGVALNPIEVLPEIQKYETRDVSQNTASSLPTFSL